jgi:membrane protein implicated in regulation of membrane protease activity
MGCIYGWGEGILLIFARIFMRTTVLRWHRGRDLKIPTTVSFPVAHCLSYSLTRLYLKEVERPPTDTTQQTQELKGQKIVGFTKFQTHCKDFPPKKMYTNEFN